ncbi:MAG: hypothetical protein HY872_01900 [Chloroflexi bacterium]|nr:hypothetical protein [Chloroflexota bacterium]
MPDLLTLRGIASNVQYIVMDGRQLRAAKSVDKADSLSFNVGERGAMAMKAKTLPVLNEGDDVEVMGAPNPRSGGLEVVALRNHTTGTEWKFSRFRAVIWP